MNKSTQTAGKVGTDQSMELLFDLIISLNTQNEATNRLPLIVFMYVLLCNDVMSHGNRFDRKLCEKMAIRLSERLEKAQAEKRARKPAAPTVSSAAAKKQAKMAEKLNKLNAMEGGSIGGGLFLK